jgi:hypothetical protein
VNKNKIARTLNLSTSTIRSLRGDALGRVAGGISGVRCYVTAVTCAHCNGSGSGGSASGDEGCGWSYGAC